VGIKIDIGYLKKLSIEYHIELAKLEKKIYTLAKQEFNINSPKQLSEILFEKLQLSIKNHKKTGSGLKSTRESELEKMKDLHPIIGEIILYRELQKLLSTYIDNIPGMVGSDGRLHARFLQAGTTTGRMSSQNPNLQNIPIKTELGRNIRNAFVADKGFMLAAFDYSQIELRVAAFLSGDEKLLKIFKEGRDVHTEVASYVFKVPAERVDKEMRRQAKVINFGILYGMGVNALKENLGSDRATAQKFYNQYFETFKTLAKYLDKVKSEAARVGYTETFFGRKRYFEGIRSKIPYIKASAERMAINAPIQGTEADVVKLAMVKIDLHLRSKNELNDVRVLLQVHDEIIYEIKEEKAKRVAEEIKHIMENVVDPKDIKGIRLTANSSIGKNWGEMH
jgi:DNA polymerase-1